MAYAQQKLLSQNFLKSSELVRALVENSSISQEDVVLEIGSGPGIITKELLTKAGKIIAIELDRNYFEELKIKFANFSNLELHNSDFLTFSLPLTPYKVFSNPPFKFTGEIIQKLLQTINPPNDLYLIVQKEAADKYTGTSLTSVLNYPWFEFSIYHQFSRTDFTPIPNINAVMLRIYKRPVSLVKDENKEVFQDFSAYVFSQKKPHIIHLQDNPTRIDLRDWVKIFQQFLLVNDQVKLKRIKGASKKLFSEQKSLQKIHRTRTDKDWKTFGVN